MPSSSPTIVFCPDAELGYERSRTRFETGEGLALDETYRLAHLPLVAPGHPRVIESREGTSYVMGRHERVFSLVLPVLSDLLQSIASLPRSGRGDASIALCRQDRLGPAGQAQGQAACDDLRFALDGHAAGARSRTSGVP